MEGSLEAARAGVLKDLMSRGDFDRLRDDILARMKTDVSVAFNLPSAAP